MDLLFLIGVVVALLAILITLFFIQKKNSSQEKEPRQQRQQPQQVIRPDGLNRRAQIARNQRNRLRQNAQAAVAGGANDEANDGHANAGNDDDSDDEIPKGAVLDEKMGAKKRAKMEAKEQKRLLREQEIKLREERKVKEAQEEDERKKLEEREAAEEQRQQEAERLAREERERKEYEEYLKLKATFSVEEEGYEEGDADEQANLLSGFIQYIKDNKVVVLEDVAVEFKMKTQQVIDRIQELQESGALTGVIDDRGKFIYVSEDELAAVAKFIKQRGRVSIAELAECSNKLINLTPVGGS